MERVRKEMGGGWQQEWGWGGWRGGKKDRRRERKDGKSGEKYGRRIASGMGEEWRRVRGGIGRGVGGGVGGRIGGRMGGAWQERRPGWPLSGGRSPEECPHQSCS